MMAMLRLAIAFALGVTPSVCLAQHAWQARDARRLSNGAFEMSRSTSLLETSVSGPAVVTFSLTSAPDADFQLTISAGACESSLDGADQPQGGTQEIHVLSGAQCTLRLSFLQLVRGGAEVSAPVVAPLVDQDLANSRAGRQIRLGSRATMQEMSASQRKEVLASLAASLGNQTHVAAQVAARTAATSAVNSAVAASMDMATALNPFAFVDTSALLPALRLVNRGPESAIVEFAARETDRGISRLRTLAGRASSFVTTIARGNPVISTAVTALAGAFAALVPSAADRLRGNRDENDFVRTPQGRLLRQTAFQSNLLRWMAVTEAAAVTYEQMTQAADSAAILIEEGDRLRTEARAVLLEIMRLAGRDSAAADQALVDLDRPGLLESDLAPYRTELIRRLTRSAADIGQAEAARSDAAEVRLRLERLTPRFRRLAVSTEAMLDQMRILACTAPIRTAFNRRPDPAVQPSSDSLRLKNQLDQAAAGFAASRNAYRNSSLWAFEGTPSRPVQAC